jgi:hypothetical protein
MRKFNYNRQTVIKSIIVGYFLLAFFSYFFFFITNSAMSGKEIEKEKQINITILEFKKPNINQEKVENFILILGVLLLAILIVFYLSKFFHKKIVKSQNNNRGYKPFKKIN